MSIAAEMFNLWILTQLIKVVLCDGFWVGKPFESGGGMVPLLKGEESEA